MTAGLLYRMEITFKRKLVICCGAIQKLGLMYTDNTVFHAGQPAVAYWQFSALFYLMHFAY
jgi:hypothetical protein